MTLREYLSKLDDEALAEKILRAMQCKKYPTCSGCIFRNYDCDSIEGLKESLTAEVDVQFM